MRVALVAPVEVSVPPAGYGGIEQLVHLLDHDLVARGHDVLLLASGGSTPAGNLVELLPEPLAVPGKPAGSGRSVVESKNTAARRAAGVLLDVRPDVILNHTWRLLDHLDGVPRSRVLTTVHYPLDVDPYRDLILSRPMHRYVSVSWSQQRAAPTLNFAANVYNGIDVDAYPMCPSAGNHVVYLGRCSPHKGLDLAIRAAQAAGVPLRVAAKLDAVDRDWFDSVIAPLARRGGVEFVGEVVAADKGTFLADALGLLHPSRWSEPFGLAAVEAMACGTPVVMLRRGAADEIVADGTTGFVVTEEDDLAAAVERLPEIDRAACRERAKALFDRQQMADGYESLFGEGGSW